MKINYSVNILVALSILILSGVNELHVQAQITVSAPRTTTVNNANDGLVDGNTVTIEGTGSVDPAVAGDGVSLTTNESGNGVTVNVNTGGSITTDAAGPGVGVNLGSGTVTNDGTITTNGGSSSSGISIVNVRGGTVINNGVIQTNGTASTDDAVGNNGIRVVEGDVVNNGTITTAGDFSAGIVVAPDFAGGSGGSVSNSGTITTTGNNSAGIVSNSGGSIINEMGGTITTTGISENGGFVDGILMIGNSSDTATNNGTININGSGSNGVLTGGINVRDGATAVNNGTINLNSNGTDGGGFNAGLYSSGGSSQLTNTSMGTINILSLNSSGLSAATSGNTMTNDGDIFISTTAFGGIVNPVTNGMTGSTAGSDTLINGSTGQIVINNNGDGIANGMSSGGGNTLTNEGMIILNSDNSNGIFSDGNDTITNASTGTINVNNTDSTGMTLNGGATANNAGIINVNNDTNTTGVSIDGASAVTFTNDMSGTINLNAASNAISTTGGGVGHTLTNNGTINSGMLGGFAAPGSNIFNIGNGDIATNNGTINTNDAGSTAFNTFEAGATIVNGTAGVINTADDGTAGAANSINDTFGAASITNDGTINNTTGGSAILSNSAMTTNSGTINLTDSDGVTFGNTAGDVLNHTGTINLNATGNTNHYAIVSMGDGSTINLEGAISATATGAGTANGLLLMGTAGDTINIGSLAFISVPFVNGSQAIQGMTAVDHTININGGIITNGSTAPGIPPDVISLAGGDDTINLSGAFSITGTVDMGGQGGTGDTLNIGNILAPQATIDELAALQAAPTTSGTVETPSGTFSYNDVENLNINLNTIFSAQNVLPETLSDFGAALDNTNVNLDPAFGAIVTAYSNANPNDRVLIGQTLSGQTLIDAQSRIQFNSNVQFTNSFFRRLSDFQYSPAPFGSNGLVLMDGSLPPLLASTSHVLSASSALQQASDSFSSGASTLLSAMTLTEMLALEERETAPKAENKFVADVIGFGSFAQQDATANRPESEYYLASATLRAGYRVNKDLTVGGYAGYNRTDADVDTLGSELEAQGAHVGAFVDYRYKGFTFSGLLGYTYSDYDSDRVVLGVNQTATSNTDSHQLLLAGQVAYEFLLDSEKTWSLTPILGFHFAHQMTDGYTESGAGAGNLTVEDTDAQSFQSKVGIEVSKTFLYQEGKRLTVFANGFYHHEFLDDGRDVNVAFNSAAVNAFTVQTEDPERDFANLGMGLESIPFSNPNLRFIGGYQYQFGQDSFTSHNVYAGGRYDF